MATPQKIASPEKEIRFTRAAQGRLFLVIVAVLINVSWGLWVLAHYQPAEQAPKLQGYGWLALLPWPLIIVLTRLATRCIRHAYVIFTPLGIEVFPLFRPEKTMMLVTWQEVAVIEMDPLEKKLLIHYNAEKTSGVIVSLAPILSSQRKLMRHAVNAITEKRKASSL